MSSLSYQEKAVRIELDAMDQLCKLFNCSVGDLFGYLPDEPDD
jgi:putative transcriptional regulator